MTRKLQTGLAFLLLLVAISCTKENDNSPFSSSGSSKSLTSSSTDQAVASDDIDARFNFSGSWVLHWSWSCGIKSSTSWFFASNGTFSDGFGETGVWVAGPHTVLFKFNGFNEHWGGHDTRGTIDGIMTTFSSSTFNSHGCFTMTRTASSSSTQNTGKIPPNKPN